MSKLTKNLPSSSVISCTIAKESQDGNNCWLMFSGRVSAGRSKNSTNRRSNRSLWFVGIILNSNPRWEIGERDLLRYITSRTRVVLHALQTESIVEVGNDGIFGSGNVLRLEPANVLSVCPA